VSVAPELHGPTVVLRETAPQDAPELRRIRRQREVEQWWDPLEDDFPMGDEPDVDRLTVWRDEAIVGMVQVGQEPEPKYRSASIDLFLDAAHHGQGIGTEVVRLVLAHVVQTLGHHRVTIEAAVDNHRAIACYEKAGFRRIGVAHRSERDSDGRGWHDELLMEFVT